MRLRTLHEAAAEYQVDPETIQRLVLCGKIRLEAEDIEAALEEGVEDMPIEGPLRGAPLSVFLALQRALDSGENPTQADLGRGAGYTDRTVREALRTLEEAGYIRVIREKGKKQHRYEILREL